MIKKVLFRIIMKSIAKKNMLTTTQSRSVTGNEVYWFQNINHAKRQ